MLDLKISSFRTLHDIELLMMLSRMPLLLKLMNVSSCSTVNLPNSSMDCSFWYEFTIENRLCAFLVVVLRIIQHKRKRLIMYGICDKHVIECCDGGWDESDCEGNVEPSGGFVHQTDNWIDNPKSQDQIQNI